VDGVVVPPGDVRFGGTDNNDYNLDAATHSMQWVRTSLEPGSHTVKVQLWRGNLTVFKNRTLTVLQFVQGPTRVV
jgi:hypothetical protein